MGWGKSQTRWAGSELAVLVAEEKGLKKRAHTKKEREAVLTQHPRDNTEW